jgi:DNA-binding ferritin-like protein (Dps family)
MSEQTELQLIITAQNQATQELAKLGKDMNALQNKTQSSSLSFGKMAGVLATVGIGYGVIKNGIMDSISAFNESEKVMAQTNAVLASTKGVAGMSAQAVGDLAKSIQNLTTFDDEAIQSAENMLLTFTAIGKDVFPEATWAIADMSQALGQDLKSSTIQIGKALQDPIKGVTALRKVGVNFNETQTETIKKLVDSGKAMDAQKLILKELATEFGGSAKAQLNTFGGRMTWLKNQVGDLQETLGGTLVNSLTVMTGGFNMSADGTVSAFEKMKGFIQKWLPAILIGLQTVFKYVGSALAMIGNGVFAFGKILVAVFMDAYDTIKNLGSGFAQLGQVIKMVMTGDFEGAMNAFTNIQVVASARTQKAIEEESTVMGLMWDDFKNIGTNALNDYDKTQQLATQGTKDFGGAAAGAGDSVKEMGKKVKDGQKKISDLSKEYKKAINDIKNDIKSLKSTLDEDNKKSDATLGKDIATEIVAKQKEQESLRKQIQAETDETKKVELQTELDTVTGFLDAHKSEQQQYATEILEAKKVDGLDSIQLMQYQHDQEQIERNKEFEKDMADLQDKLKAVKKEYKDKFKELKKELKDEGLDTLTLKIKAIVDKINGKDDDKKKRATGGSVTGGQSYLVGERGPELFTPSSNGNINNNPVVGGGQTQNFSFNFAGANITDIRMLKDEIIKSINRSQELNRLGIR